MVNITCTPACAPNVAQRLRQDGVPDPPNTVIEPPIDVIQSILSPNGEDYAQYDLRPYWIFQEAVGPNYADTIGSPIGLAIGREFASGKTLSDIVEEQTQVWPQPNFDASTGLTLSNGWSIAGGQATKTTSAGGAITDTTYIPVVGGLYYAQFTITNVVVSGGGISAYIGGNPTASYASVGNYAGFISAANTNRMAISTRGSGDWNGSVDNVSYRRVPQHYANQTVSNSRPVLQVGGAKFDGSDDSLLTNWTPAFQLGSELVVNGDMSSATGWTLNANAAISGGTLNITGAIAAGVQIATNTGLTVSGKKYRVSYNITTQITGGGQVSVGTGNSFGVARTSVGSYTDVVTGDGGFIKLFARLATVSAGAVDNISVKEITGGEEMCIIALFTMPATPRTGIIAGVRNAGGENTTRLQLTSYNTGRIAAAIAAVGESVITGGSVRSGQRVVAGLSLDGTNYSLFSDEGLLASGTYGAFSPDTVAYRIGGRNNNGNTGDGFFNNLVEKIIFGKKKLTPATFAKIADELLKS